MIVEIRKFSLSILLLWNLALLLVLETDVVRPDLTWKREQPSETVSVQQLRQTARNLDADSRFLFGFPTGSSISLTATVLTSLVSEGPITGKLNLTWVPVAISIDRPQMQMQYIQGSRSRQDDLIDIYSHLKSAVSWFGYNGEDCLLRSYCEAAGRRGDSEFTNKIMQLVLGASDLATLEKKQYSHETLADLTKLDAAKQRGSISANQCLQIYKDCPISFFDVLESFNFI